MARKPEPRWYESRGGWYCWLRGKQVRLAVGKKARAEAWAAFHRLMLESGEATPRVVAAGLTCRELFDLWIDHADRECSKATQANVRRFAEVARPLWDRKVASLKAAEVEAWADRPTWNANTRSHMLTHFRQAISWGVRSGLVARNPIPGLRVPPMGQRHVDVSPGDVTKVLAAAPPEFRALLELLHETGMRPSEVYKLEARDVRIAERRIVLEDHKTVRWTRKPKVVYLSPRAVEILAPIVGGHAGGPIFRNHLGRPWTHTAAARKLRVIREKAGVPRTFVPDAFRHAFVTDALLKGVPMPTVAVLLDHKSTKMIERHYNQIAKRTDHLLEAVGKIRPPRKARKGGGVSGGDASA